MRACVVVVCLIAMWRYGMCCTYSFASLLALFVCAHDRGTPAGACSREGPRKSSEALASHVTRLGRVGSRECCGEIEANSNVGRDHLRRPCGMEEGYGKQYIGLAAKLDSKRRGIRKKRSGLRRGILRY